MSVAELKGELLRMIEHETDMDVLQLMRQLLQKKHNEAAYREELIRRTLISEEDIKNGRLFTPEEAIKRIR
ncbi:hypothetical protein [Chryseolinea lacunae]|uniref:Addiction module antitoxin RelB n=1 Tax=Chryseolinea lacunae TaxID=2801331 RepID=A0ABS1KNF3_9BACT|nr:hypothetical protein [Chryseolinea lacunae]MBL0740858.1 hypothetical protein [Chryseolinea lacunae]